VGIVIIEPSRQRTHLWLIVWNGIREIVIVIAAVQMETYGALLAHISTIFSAFGTRRWGTTCTCTCVSLAYGFHGIRLESAGEHFLVLGFHWNFCFVKAIVAFGTDFSVMSNTIFAHCPFAIRAKAGVGLTAHVLSTRFHVTSAILVIQKVLPSNASDT
jgi:hypothetical protein